MKLSAALWCDLETYLYIDKKFDDKAHNKSALLSRFRIICRFFDEKEFNRTNFNQFILHLKSSGKKPAYLNGFIKLAKHIDKYYQINQLQDYTYFHEQRVKNYDVLSPEEIGRIIAVDVPYYRNSGEINHRNKIIISFLAYTGCRISEALNLHWCDVITEPIPCVTFRETKNKEDRQIPIDRSLMNDIQTLPRGGNNRVFGVRDDSEVNKDIQRRALLVGIKKRVWNHLLRHSYITNGSNSGTMQIEDISLLVGHKNLNTTMSYKHTALAHFAQIIHAHPMYIHNQTIDMIERQVNEFFSKSINRNKFNLSISVTQEGIEIDITRAASRHPDGNMFHGRSHCQPGPCSPDDVDPSPEPIVD